MKQLIEFLIKNIVDKPDEVIVTETESEYGYVEVSVKVSDDDMGKVIGKSGKTIAAIRRIAKAKAIKDGKRIQVVLVDNRPREEYKMEEETSSESEE